MPKIHRDRAPTYSYPVGLLPPAPAPSADEPPEATAPHDLPPPAASATKTSWAIYARKVGVDPTGLTKAQIRKAVA